MTAVLERGAVVIVRLDPTQGSEVGKTRRAVVVSNDVACRADGVVQIVPVAGFAGLPDQRSRRYDSRCGAGSSGLAEPSRAVANQIRTVSRYRLDRVVGRLSDDEMAALDRALRKQLALP